MKGFLISIKAKSNGDRIMFNTLFYGKLNYKKEKNEAYYIPGMLDSIPYLKITVGKVFVESLGNMNIELLKEFAEVTITSCNRNINKHMLRTGEQHWKLVSLEHYPIFRKSKRERRILFVNGEKNEINT